MKKPLPRETVQPEPMFCKNLYRDTRNKPAPVDWTSYGKAWLDLKTESHLDDKAPEANIGAQLLHCVLECTWKRRRSPGKRLRREQKALVPIA